MIYDCFMLYNELDLLEIRLNVLDPVVDKFVIAEAKTTFMGKPKRLYFEENRDRFAKFSSKIIYQVIDSEIYHPQDQWEREDYQKNDILKGIKGLEDDDIIIFSDLDEIPNPVQIQSIVNDFQEEMIYHFAQRMYYMFLNYEEVSHALLSASGDFESVRLKQWLGSRMCQYKIARQTKLTLLRTKEYLQDNAIRVSNGGWHFSYMGGSGETAQKRVKDKLKALSHNEFNSPRYYSYLNIGIKMILGRDFLGRGAKFKKVKIDETYPKWIQEHYKEYNNLVLHWGL